MTAKRKKSFQEFAITFLKQPITEEMRRLAAFPLPDRPMSNYEALRYVMVQAGHDVSMYPETLE